MVTPNSLEKIKRRKSSYFQQQALRKQSMYFNKVIAGKETPATVPLPQEVDLQEPRPGWVTIARTWHFPEDWLTQEHRLNSAPSSFSLAAFLWQEHPPAAASQRSITCLLHGPENCASSATLVAGPCRYSPGFPCLQQAATDPSACSTQASRHLPNTFGVCILLRSLCQQGSDPCWVLGLPLYKHLIPSVLKNPHTTEQKKAELRQDRHYSVGLTRDPVLSYVLLGFCYTGSTHCQEKPQNHWWDRYHCKLPKGPS